MNNCIVLVDAGYLLGAAATLLTGEATRSRLTTDYPGLIQQIRERAERETGQPLLRIYWFDAAPDRLPQPDHRRLRVLSRVTVWLGTLSRVEGRARQKGVDAAIHAQLTELARHRAASDIVLVTGDGDLLPGVIQAKVHGVAVHLWAVQAADREYNQSEDLVAEADERQLLDRVWLTQAVAARSVPAPADQAAAAPALPPVSLRSPAPAGLAGSSSAALRWSSDTGYVDPEGDVPLLESLSTPQQVWADREADLAVGGEAGEVGRIFAARWVARLPEEETPDLLLKVTRAYPWIPRRLDSELLRYATKFNPRTGAEGEISGDHRRDVRAGFWKVVRNAPRTVARP